MKRLLKNPALRKLKFECFSKLPVSQMIYLKGGNDETPPEEELPKKY
jgi:hypothetical protein